MKPVKKFVWKMLGVVGLDGAVQLLLNGYLKDKGWFRSFTTKTSIDAAGNPIPWLTYSFMYFFEKRTRKEFKLFEYGCGNSTIWFSQRFSRVDAVEHHQGWYEKIKPKLPDNVGLRFVPLEYGGDYSKAVKDTGLLYDVIIVDGRDRLNCVEQSLPCLTPGGVLVFDNSNVSSYAALFPTMQAAGFKWIEFEGMQGVTNVMSITTVFYRPDNCLGI